MKRLIVKYLDIHMVHAHLNPIEDVVKVRVHEKSIQLLKNLLVVVEHVNILHLKTVTSSVQLHVV